MGNTRFTWFGLMPMSMVGVLEKVSLRKLQDYNGGTQDSHKTPTPNTPKKLSHPQLAHYKNS